MEIITLEDEIRNSGNEVHSEYLCHHCSKAFPAFALVSDDNGGYICGHCRIELERISASEIPKISSTGWDGEEGLRLWARRNILLETYAWTIRNDSPLSEESMLLWADWFDTMHRLTVDNPTPNEEDFPELPPFSYSENGAVRARIEKSKT